MKDGTNIEGDTVNTEQNEAEATEGKRGRGGKDNPGRPKNSSRNNMVDLVTFNDIRQSVKVMKEIIRSETATAGQKLTAAKFLLSVKLEGINLEIKRKANQDKQTKAQQNEKPDKPSHIIKTHYKETPAEPTT